MSWLGTLSPPAAALAAAALAVLPYLALVGGVMQLSRGRRALAALPGCGLAIYAVALFGFGDTVSFWHFSAFWAVVVAGTIFVYGAVAKSLSLEMLTLLARAEGGVLTPAQLTVGVVEPAYAKRADLLVQGGLATAGDEGYRVTPAGRALAGRLQRIRGRLQIGDTRLYGGTRQRRGG